MRYANTVGQCLYFHHKTDTPQRLGEQNIMIYFKRSLRNNAHYFKILEVNYDKVTK